MCLHRSGMLNDSELCNLMVYALSYLGNTKLPIHIYLLILIFPGSIGLLITDSFPNDKPVPFAQFVDFFASNFFAQLVDFPTRENNLLYLILVDVSCISNVCADLPLCNSGNVSIVFDLIITNVDKQNIITDEATANALGPPNRPTAATATE